MIWSYLRIPVAALVMFLAALGSFNLAVWVTDRDPPIRYLNARALSPFVEQGGSIGIEIILGDVQPPKQGADG